MAVKIRLRKTGRKRQPSYRIVVADSESPRDGRFIELLGHYFPRAKDKEFDVDVEKARAWLSKGATPSETVRPTAASRPWGGVPGDHLVRRAPRLDKAAVAAVQ